MATTDRAVIENRHEGQLSGINDKKLAESLAFIFQRENLGLNVTLPDAATTLTNRDAVVMADTSGGSFTLTLAPANTWRGRSPIVVVMDVGTNTLTVAPSSGDTLDGGNIVVKNPIAFISDGLLTWYTIGLKRGTTTPTPTAGSGSLTTASSSIKYSVEGDRVFFNATVTITTNGTGAGDIRVAAPFTPAELSPIYGFDNDSPSNALTGFVSGTTIFIKQYDGTYPGASGRVLYVSGHYRI